MGFGVWGLGFIEIIKGSGPGKFRGKFRGVSRSFKELLFWVFLENFKLQGA